MGNISPESIVSDLRYLQLLSRSFPTIADASTEIINLEAILNLPKGTEHFLTDIHGEYEAFQHVLKNGSGAVKRKVNEIFGHTLRESEKKELCTLIYYPEEKLQLVKVEEKDLDDWYQITLNQLVKVCQNVSSKYTRSKVRKSLPQEFSYIIQELLHESSIDPNKQAYINVIISTIISTKRADDFIVAMCNLIQRLTIDSLHIVGDIYDRGPGAHIIMDTLCDYHNFDIQWGNHDLLWMGAASGNDACIANVIRLSMRYGNLATLEDGYGINLLPLATFAMDAYADDPCTVFAPKMAMADGQHNEKTLRLIAQMHKAITVIQFKLEAAIIDRRPEFGMEGRKLLDKVDYARGIFACGGKEYPLRDTCFPTIDPANPYRLSDEEQDIVDKIHASFMNSEKLKKHMRCLYTYGGMYLVCNSNLLYHASVPLNEDGSFKHVRIGEKEYWGHKLLQKTDQLEGQDGHLRALFRGRQGAVQGDERLVLHPPQRGRYLRPHPAGVWCAARSALSHHQRPRPCQDPERRKARQSQWQAFGDRRRFLQSLSAGDGHCGLHPCLSFPRPSARAARAFPKPSESH